MAVVDYEPGGTEIDISANYGSTGRVAYVISLSVGGLDREPFFIGSRVGGNYGG